LSDRNGEQIVPIIQGSRQSSGMPAIPVSPEDANALAAYVRSVEETIGRQGTPPSVGVEPLNVVVGDAREGQVFFAAKCAACHSPTGDLNGIGARISDARVLQNTWVAGGGRGGRRSGAAADASSRRTVTAAVTLPTGEVLQGRLVRIDDFLVTIALADGSVRTIRRDGDKPKVDIHDPMKGHRDLLAQYTDKDMHDVTAYLVTLK
jgi:cytochrome c oxidase cbb3-type subunit 3